MENRKGCGNFITKILLISLLAIAIIILLVLIFPTKGNFNSLYDSIFRNNINTMRDAGEKYFTNERLPKNVGDSEKITLRELESRNLILPFKDKNGKSCNVDKSYIKVTKNDTEYEMKVYLKCDGEDAYIIEYLGCTNYCFGDTNCNKTCKEQTLYEYKKDSTVKKITGYTCPSGYKKDGNICYKTTTKEEAKNATPVYETNTETEIATPKYETKKTTIAATPKYSETEDKKAATPSYTTKTIKIDGTPVYKESTEKIAATPHTVTNQTYRYLYQKNISKQYSAWSDWSESKEYDPNNNNIVWGEQELIWNAKNGAKKVTTTKTITDKNQPIYETTYDNVIGTYKRYVCSGYNYYINTTTMTVYKYGEWVSQGTSTYTYMPQSSDPNVVYIFKGMSSECNGDCIETPKFIVEKRVRTATAVESSTTNNLTATCNVTAQDIPIYGMRKKFVGYVTDKVVTVNYVYLYHTKTRTITRQAYTDSKWTDTYNDPTLVNNGYTYVRSEVASSSTSTYYTCKEGYTLSGSECYKKTSKITGYTCPTGYTKNGSSCTKEEKTITGYICEAGYNLSGTDCYKKTSKITGYTCPEGYTKNDKNCTKEEKVISGYTCKAGYTLSGTTCYKKSDSKLIGYKCDSNAYTLDGKTCRRTVSTTSSIAATPIYGDKNVTEYKWSATDIKGWTKTGNKKVDTVCE